MSGVGLTLLLMANQKQAVMLTNATTFRYSL